MKIKTYTGFLNGEELREVYRDNYYSIHKSYGDFIFYEVIRYSPKFDWIGTVKHFDDALKLIDDISSAHYRPRSIFPIDPVRNSLIKL